MKITIYELLGLVKDGKAPEKIKYNDNIYYLIENRVDLHTYQTMGSNTTRRLSLIIDNEYLNLNDYVEIIEEPKKIEKIKRLNNVADCKELIELEDKQHINNHILKDKINELIDEINNLKEK